LTYLSYAYDPVPRKRFPACAGKVRWGRYTGVTLPHGRCQHGEHPKPVAPRRATTPRNPTTGGHSRVIRYGTAARRRRAPHGNRDAPPNYVKTSLTGRRAARGAQGGTTTLAGADWQLSITGLRFEPDRLAGDELAAHPARAALGLSPIAKRFI